jgi:ribosome-binding factor A
MSNRILKVSKLVKQEVGKLILSDINFSSDVVVTVTKVEISSDLHYADVFVSSFPAEQSKEVKKALDENIYFLQQKINKKLSMKSVPKIRFKIDKSGEYVERIDKLIKKVNRSGN